MHFVYVKYCQIKEYFSEVVTKVVRGPFFGTQSILQIIGGFERPSPTFCKCSTLYLMPFPRYKQFLEAGTDVISFPETVGVGKTIFYPWSVVIFCLNVSKSTIGSFV